MPVMGRGWAEVRLGNFLLSVFTACAQPRNTSTAVERCCHTAAEQTLPPDKGDGKRGQNVSDVQHHQNLLFSKCSYSVWEHWIFDWSIRRLYAGTAKSCMARGDRSTTWESPGMVFAFLHIIRQCLQSSTDTSEHRDVNINVLKTRYVKRMSQINIL